MKEKFRLFLISKGYKEFTPSGNKSTVYDYLTRVEKILESESLTWDELPAIITTKVSEYDIGGSKELIGRKSHNAYISALKAFQCFVNETHS